MKTRIQ